MNNKKEEINLSIQPWSEDLQLQVIHIRLTDSCLASLEQFAKNSCNGNLQIQATNESSGVFIVNNKSLEEKKEFKFSCKSLNSREESKQHLICLKPKTMNNFDLGELNNYIQINANEEIFHSTKEKLNALEETKIKSGTKELKPSLLLSSNNSTSIMNNRRHQELRGVVASKNRIQSVAMANKQKNYSPLKPIESSKIQKNKILNKNNFNHNQNEKNKSSNFSQQAKMQAKLRPLPKSLNLRKRILHHFAVRPYKKSDIIKRLQNEGLNEGDFRKIDDILTQLINDYQTLKYDKNALLTLKPNFKQYVDLKWPLFSVTDLQLVKRNIGTIASVDEKKSDEMTKITDIKSKNLSESKNPQENLCQNKNDFEEKNHRKADSKDILNNNNNVSYSNHNKSNIDDINEDKNINNNVIVNKKIEINNTLNPIVEVDRKNNSDTKNLSSNELNAPKLDNIDDIESNNLNTMTSITDSQYEDFVKEYTRLYPKYKEIYEQIQSIREKFKLYHRQLQNIDSNDISSDKLYVLKSKILKDNDLLESNFDHDVSELKRMHSRVIQLKKIITNHIDNRKNFEN